MGKTEINNFIVLATSILLVFILGIIIFIVQYHKRKLAYEREKALINEQHIQDLLNTRLEIQEQTMHDIGRDIHDNVGQKLTLASVYAGSIALEKDAVKMNQQISEVRKIIDESLSDLRSLSKNMTNISTDVAELILLLENECKRINALNICHTECRFNHTGFTISTTNKNFILRIMQEFIQNSLKHANCRNIRIDFNFAETGLSGVAKDDGKGFDMEEVSKRSKLGIGLNNMKKRAELIGANFSIHSIIDEGTTLHLFIPAGKLNVS